MSQFPLDIEITLQIDRARAELRRFLDEAAKGVTVPLRTAGGAIGGGAGGATTLEAAEQQAVQSAMDQATNRAPGIRPSVVAPDVQSAFANMRARVDRMSATLGGVTPGEAVVSDDIRSRFAAANDRVAAMMAQVHTMGGLGGSAAATALAVMGGRAMGFPNGPSAIPISIPNAPWWGGAPQMLAGGGYPMLGTAAGGAMGPPGGGMPAMFGAAGGPLMLPAPAGAGVQQINIPNAVGGAPGGAGAASGGRLGRLSQWLGTNSYRGLLGLFAAGEINHALGAVRGADVAERLATSPEEALLARAQANVQATSGLIGGTLALIPNILDIPGSPQRTLREAQTSSTLAQRASENEQARLGITVERAYRDAFSTGGDYRADIARAEAEAESQSAPLTHKRRLLDLSLKETVTRYQQEADEYGGSSLRAYDAPKLDGQDRTQALDDLNTVNARLQEISDAKKFTVDRLTNERTLLMGQSERSRRRMQRIGLGASTRYAQLDETRGRYQDAIQAATLGNDQPLADQLGREQESATYALTRGFNDEDNQTRRGLFFGAQQASLSAGNRPTEAAISGIMAASTDRAIQMQRTGGEANSPGMQALLRTATLANIGAVVAPVVRDWQAQGIGLRGSIEQSAAILNRNPLGAALSGIQTQRDLALQQAGSLPWGMRQLSQMGINIAAQGQAAVVRQQFADQRYDVNTGLDAAINQSALRTRGGPSGQLAASLDEIVQRTRGEALNLERQGLGAEAGKRRRLGEFQVREFEANYYQGFSFQQMDPDAVATSRRGSLADMDDKFRKAERDAGKRGIGEGQGGEGNGFTKDQGETLIGLIRRLVESGLAGRLG